MFATAPFDNGEHYSLAPVKCILSTFNNCSCGATRSRRDAVLFWNIRESVRVILFQVMKLSSRIPRVCTTAMRYSSLSAVFKWFSFRFLGKRQPLTSRRQIRNFLASYHDVLYFAVRKRGAAVQILISGTKDSLRNKWYKCSTKHVSSFINVHILGMLLMIFEGALFSLSWRWVIEAIQSYSFDGYIKCQAPDWSKNIVLLDESGQVWLETEQFKCEQNAEEVLQITTVFLSYFSPSLLLKWFKSYDISPPQLHASFLINIHSEVCKPRISPLRCFKVSAPIKSRRRTTNQQCCLTSLQNMFHSEKKYFQLKKEVR